MAEAAGRRVVVELGEQGWASDVAKELRSRGFVRLRLDQQGVHKLHRLMRAAQAFFPQSQATKLVAADPAHDPDRRSGYIYTKARQVFELHVAHSENDPILNMAASHPLANEMVQAATHHAKTCMHIGSRVLSQLVLQLEAAAPMNCQALCDGQFDSSLLRVYCYNGDSSACPGGFYPPHDDLGLITLAPAATVPGLQVWTDEQWFDAEIDMGNDELLVFAGSMMQHASGGQLSALTHRVNFSSTSHRFTAPFFFRPSIDARMPPLKMDDCKGISVAEYMREIRRSRNVDASVRYGHLLQTGNHSLRVGQ